MVFIEKFSLPPGENAMNGGLKAYLIDFRPKKGETCV